MKLTGTLLEKADIIVGKTIKSISYISGVCLVGIMLVAFFNVLGEKLRSLGLPVRGIPASTEIIQYLHIPVVFLAAAHVALDRGHTKIDLVSSKFPPKVQKMFNSFGNICGVAICALISQRGFVLMERFRARNQMSSISGVGFPLWPFALILAVGFALLSFTFFWCIVREFAINTDKEVKPHD